MAWCGFVELMRTGLVTYSTGMYEAIEKKAAQCGVSVEQQFERERVELRTLERLVAARLAASEVAEPERLRLGAFLGMISIARHVISERQPGRPAVEDLAATGFELGSLIERFDALYEALPPALGHPRNAQTALDQLFAGSQEPAPAVTMARAAPVRVLG